MVYSALHMNIPAIAKATCPPDFAKAVKEILKKKMF